MIDNFEWSDGYRSKFGLYEVDFEDPMRTRRPRASAHYYANVIKAHSLDVDPNNKLTDELYFVLINTSHGPDKIAKFVLQTDLTGNKPIYLSILLHPYQIIYMRMCVYLFA
ncbi:jg24607 [Pararge aegeria aegeria]|uniref:Jg24607 protein n=1 Tax=Pararge aegeria aegeria TaxID=348720 RepID=A0A8S4RLD1_9NEOP|nr:jg24607 [Pararge aegeria aegeria]